MGARPYPIGFVSGSPKTRTSRHDFGVPIASTLNYPHIEAVSRAPTGTVAEPQDEFRSPLPFGLGDQINQKRPDLIQRNAIIGIVPD